MEDLLSLDDAVMDEVTGRMSPPLRRLPAVCWLRLVAALRGYLSETHADGCVTLRWAHLQFAQAADGRYLKQRDKAPSYHKALAEYFSSVWADRPKPYAGNEAGRRRYVAAQPLYRDEPPGGWGGSSGSGGRRYNLRRLNELPHHLLHSQQAAQLKQTCLCSFEFVLAKISGCSLRAFVADLQAALQAEPADADLRLLSDTLQLSSQALARDPRQLATQVS